jgi:radical SAM protein with 4Fe4S-binding SPASM domain
MLWKNFTVLYDGRVTPCCIDAEGELIIGNVQKSSIKEIWHGAQLKKLRELHKKGEWDKIPICARCREWI